MKESSLFRFNLLNAEVLNQEIIKKSDEVLELNPELMFLLPELQVKPTRALSV